MDKLKTEMKMKKERRNNSYRYFSRRFDGFKINCREIKNSKTVETDIEITEQSALLVGFPSMKIMKEQTAYNEFVKDYGYEPKFYRVDFNGDVIYQEEPEKERPFELYTVNSFTFRRWPNGKIQVKLCDIYAQMLGYNDQYHMRRELGYNGNNQWLTIRENSVLAFKF